MAQIGILLNTAMCGSVNVFFTAVVSKIYRICYDAGDFQNNRLSASMDNVGITFRVSVNIDIPEISLRFANKIDFSVDS